MELQSENDAESVIITYTGLKKERLKKERLKKELNLLQSNLLKNFT